MQLHAGNHALELDKLSDEFSEHTGLDSTLIRKPKREFLQPLRDLQSTPPPQLQSASPFPALPSSLRPYSPEVNGEQQWAPHHANNMQHVWADMTHRLSEIDKYEREIELVQEQIKMLWSPPRIDDRFRQEQLYYPTKADSEFPVGHLMVQHQPVQRTVWNQYASRGSVNQSPEQSMTTPAGSKSQRINVKPTASPRINALAAPKQPWTRPTLSCQRSPQGYLKDQPSARSSPLHGATQGPLWSHSKDRPESSERLGKSPLSARTNFPSTMQTPTQSQPISQSAYTLSQRQNQHVRESSTELSSRRFQNQPMTIPKSTPAFTPRRLPNLRTASPRVDSGLSANSAFPPRTFQKPTLASPGVDSGPMSNTAFTSGQIRNTPRAIPRGDSGATSKSAFATGRIHSTPTAAPSVDSGPTSKSTFTTGRVHSTHIHLPRVDSGPTSKSAFTTDRIHSTPRIAPRVDSGPSSNSAFATGRIRNTPRAVPRVDSGLIQIQSQAQRNNHGIKARANPDRSLQSSIQPSTQVQEEAQQSKAQPMAQLQQEMTQWVTDIENIDVEEGSSGTEIVLSPSKSLQYRRMILEHLWSEVSKRLAEVEMSEREEAAILAAEAKQKGESLALLRKLEELRVRKWLAQERARQEEEEAADTAKATESMVESTYFLKAPPSLPKTRYRQYATHQRSQFSGFDSTEQG
eukprot:gnl/MRDRNA2_/MRDRNA2_77083_c0_seq1.p1 gnl/MRDRNA2_/MRDRNA2_77083_c0~~gnl/MRDRNA2_/MRDRNA2_77083_c0_seq1.p1  ORF type:complete len:697 (+),score=95.10 gnl/MRDRNA2_/MRDRNA2_77083_c0_seq1:23-2092(+)